MGAIADAVLARGGEVVGVIPEHLMSKEQGHLGGKTCGWSDPCTSERR